MLVTPVELERVQKRNIQIEAIARAQAGVAGAAREARERVSAKAESDQMGYCTQYSTLQILSV